MKRSVEESYKARDKDHEDVAVNKNCRHVHSKESVNTELLPCDWTRAYPGT